jgi:Pentapeptide repeats (8 copies)
MPSKQLTLVDDCANCLGLCCTLLAFTRSADFPTDKPAGVRCSNLAPDHSCRIHDHLLAAGYRGCVTYSCFGAGPAVTAAIRADAPDGPEVPSEQVARAFGRARQLHELVWHLREASAHGLPGPLLQQLDEVVRQAERAALRDIDSLAAGSAEPLWQAGMQVLNRVSRTLRDPRPGPDLHGADLVGADLTDQDLARANLRGAHLMAARLTGSDLRGADLAGADLRDTDLHGADLRGALFLTPGQLRSARGSPSTVLSPGQDLPESWLP